VLVSVQFGSAAVALCAVCEPCCKAMCTVRCSSCSALLLLTVVCLVQRVTALASNTEVALALSTTVVVPVIAAVTKFVFMHAFLS
jgi:hypothetical protein